MEDALGPGHTRGPKSKIHIIRLPRCKEAIESTRTAYNTVGHTYTRIPSNPLPSRGPGTFYVCSVVPSSHIKLGGDFPSKHR